MTKTRDQIMHVGSVVHQVRDPWLAEQRSFCVSVASRQESEAIGRVDAQRGTTTISKGLCGQVAVEDQETGASNISAPSIGQIWSLTSSPGPRLTRLSSSPLSARALSLTKPFDQENPVMEAQDPPPPRQGLLVKLKGLLRRPADSTQTIRRRQKLMNNIVRHLSKIM